jgi:hypothetical protein
LLAAAKEESMAESRVNPIAEKVVVYRAFGMDAVRVRRDMEFPRGNKGRLAMDVYLPPEAGTVPAVVIVAGYPDAGFEKAIGCRFKDMASSASWGRLIAVSGMAAITYTNREPAADLEALLQHLLESGAALGIDATRIGLWASSGNVPLALWSLMQPGDAALACAALCYGYLLDFDGATAVADMARRFGFVNPAAGKGVEDLPRRTPLFIARAGRDEMPQLNATLDRFVARALDANLPLTLVNHPEGPHAFDLLDETEASREVVRRILGFLRFHLMGVS